MHIYTRQAGSNINVPVLTPQAAKPQAAKQAKSNPKAT